MNEQRPSLPFFDPRVGQRMFTGIHEFWYKATGGWVGGNFFGTPMLLLTTTGRKSGRKHTTPLTYLKEGDDYVIIASNGGAADDPQWWRNLRKDPSAEIQIMSKTMQVQARETESDERERIWQHVVARFPVYAGYERRTTRRIPVVLLHPA